MNKNHIFAVLLSALIIFPRFSFGDFEVDIQKKGILSCHDYIAYNSKGKPIHCEASGIIYSHGKLYFITDWWKNNKPNLFSYQWDGHSEISGIADEIKQITINETKKIEDLTLSQNGEYIFATSSFVFGPLWDKVWKPMNRLLYWPANNPHLAKILDFDDTPNEELLRFKILNSVKARYPDTEFIKIESLAALPNNRLIMAIRERGTRFDQYTYQSILLSISYEIAGNGNLYLTGEFEIIAEMKFSHPLLQKSYALSSLEYDFDSHVLYALTTYERDDNSNPFTTSLWRILSSDNFVSEENLIAELAKNCTGDPLLLPHKIEGISKIDKSHFIAVADDDRVIRTIDGTRKPYETFYYIFNLRPSVSTDSYCLGKHIDK